jgi:hypothetical protein
MVTRSHLGEEASDKLLFHIISYLTSPIFKLHDLYCSSRGTCHSSDDVIEW